MEPDRELRPDPFDQSSDVAAFGLGQRVRSGLMKIAESSCSPPVPGKVAVQVDAAAVLARTGSKAVRVQVLEEPEPGVPLWLCVLEPPGNGDSRALVTVNAANDEDAVPVAGVSSRDNSNRASQR